MGENNKSLEEAFIDFIRDSVSDDRPKTLEAIFQETLDETTPELPGDVRDKKNREPIKKPDCWI